MRPKNVQISPPDIKFNIISLFIFLRIMKGKQLPFTFRRSAVNFKDISACSQLFGNNLWNAREIGRCSSSIYNKIQVHLSCYFVTDYSMNIYFFFQKNQLPLNHSKPCVHLIVFDLFVRINKIHRAFFKTN